MQLTKLEIKGFKSFGDKVTIHFNEGVTAIVGPNGCGKSNVVDAIRWVLGEQSTRMLRSEKMENIIFNGTKTRKPSNLAEVSLTFDNAKNILPTEFTQITLTRKLYRTGESEYRLNDVQCRLKDITDLFLDTGVGSDSYAIIELKMIDEIINNKEGSRRTLFEEASGISKYKLRKKQTFGKLKDTETDLSRVEDLIFEIEKNLKVLESQAKKADRYYQLKEQYKSCSTSLATFQIAGLRHSLDKLDEQEQSQHVERSAICTEIDLLEADSQQQKLDHLTKEKNLATQQKTTNEFISKIHAYESDKKLKNEQLRFIEEKNTKLVADLERDKSQLNHVFDRLKKLNEELLQEDKSLEIIKTSLEKNKTNVDELRSKQQKDKLELDQTVKENNELQNQVYSLEKEVTILHIQQEALSQESNRNLSDANNTEAALNEFNKAIALLENKLASKQNECALLQKQEDEIQQHIVATKESILVSKERLSTKNRLLDAKQNEYNLTKSLVDNLEGFPESIRFLKRNASWTKSAPLLSDVFSCKEEYRTSIENYLEPVMNHYVVETQADAVQAIRLLSDSTKGRARFFVLDTVKTNSDQSPTYILDKTKFIAALDIIDVEPKYFPLCEFLLQHVYILQSDDGELETALPEGQIVILSGKGKFTKCRIEMSGGSIGLFDGKRIGRAKNLENLANDIKLLEATIQQLKSETDQAGQKLNTLQSSSKRQEIQQAQQSITNLRNELTSVKAKEEQHVAFIENSQTRKQDIEQKIASINPKLLQLGPQLDELKAQKQIKTDLLAQQQKAYNELADSLTHQSTTYNQENIHFHQQQNKVATIKKEIQFHSNEEQSLNSRMIIHHQELEENQINMKNLLQQSNHPNEDPTQMYLEKEALEKGLEELEQEYYASRGLITETEEKIAQLRKNKDRTDFITNEIKDKKNALKIELNGLKERLSIEFSIDITDLLDMEVPLEESEADLRTKTNRLKRQLDEYGSINPMAMEAYQEISQRHTFIQDQKKDLLDAKASLIQTIKEIDDTAREKFMLTFSACRTHFIDVFRSLFNEEDSCDLILTDPENPLESDIDIMARPKGKRPLSINQLSGGEKTLTATALLFSLYLLKPAPFCIFDEVDAPLDDTNIDKFNTIIRKFSDRSQFIVVSHNKRTIAMTDIIYGVTMIEQGISRVVAVDMREVA